ncbi:molybdopterin binding oxidoreductase [Macroventuria anomochaeta]|uniref:Molybdopterin binding oxidoreductase n=1 Tax=Macroventuria anomochaeta TaxID=301207 RepID=A0ACB6RN51_9PLEO|nr:molybdopterin binding oxidoreductase [Macroventuria anomochaeta]KAF2623158.1 molybdopterin binding oxidoreductase [Macroventuria anomochaeta]
MYSRFLKTGLGGTLSKTQCSLSEAIFVKGQGNVTCVEVRRPIRSIKAPEPHKQAQYITQDDMQFEEYHTGIAVVDPTRWKLVIDGLVEKPLVLSPESFIAAVHECYVSALHPSKTNLWKVGNVTWTGVRLPILLKSARPLPTASSIWSEGSDHGTIAGKKIHPRPERGGPVRLVVPGWFGTYLPKRLRRILNIVATIMSPIWAIKPNSMIVHPAPGACLEGLVVSIRGWAWGTAEIVTVEIQLDETPDWAVAKVHPQEGFSWQGFTASVKCALDTSCFSPSDINSRRTTTS